VPNKGCPLYWTGSGAAAWTAVSLALALQVLAGEPQAGFQGVKGRLRLGDEPLIRTNSNQPLEHLLLTRDPPFGLGYVPRYYLDREIGSGHL
jgi:hypothetical protein